MKVGRSSACNSGLSPATFHDTHPSPDPQGDAEDQVHQRVRDQLQAAAGEHLHIFDYRVIDTATYFWRAQQLIAEQIAEVSPDEGTRRRGSGSAAPVELDPYELAELERAPLSEAARDELRRRMYAGEEVYPYQSAGSGGRWCVWLTDEPGRVHIDVWEMIVGYWRTRAQARREGTNAELVAKYGLQGPPAQRAAAARLSAHAMLHGEHPGHARQIVLYAYHEADSYLQAHAPENDTD